MNNSKQFLTAARIYYGQMRQAAQAAETVTPKVVQVKNVQKKFQIDDGLLVHVKGGVGDNLLYKGTFALTLIGVGLSLATFYRLIFRK